MKYLASRSAAGKPNINEFLDVKNTMMTSQIQCFKYNSTIDKSIQKYTCFDAFLSLSQDGREIIITNRKPLGRVKNEDDHHHDEGHNHDESEYYDSEEEKSTED